MVNSKNMGRLYWVFVLAVVIVSSSARPHKCEQRERSLADLDLAEDALNRAKLLIPNCDENGVSNSSECSRKDKSLGIIQVALNLISDAKKTLPVCNKEPPTVVTTVEPLTTVTTVEPLTNVTSVEPLTNVTTVEPLTNVTRIEPLANVTSVEPLTNATSVEPLTNATRIEPLTNATTLNLPETTRRFLRWTARIAAADCTSACTAWLGGKSSRPDGLMEEWT
ncbi:hypothetical protein JTE90_022096 [Oedothorax gibbosus]|uniref:Uncharacterized protein n=1 Tax=Oedothorax gibbosus TaxID=931172 RepID=A0AAV6TN72_9ARAC|nr:hypothetical protein JTE90_022096 [Oedothorax gibbosus]